MFVSLVTFVDSVSHESSLEGDFESTGNDFREYTYERDEIDGLVQDFVYRYNQHAWENSITDFELYGDLLYDADGEQDLKTGIIDFQRLGLIFGDDVSPDEKRMIRTLLADAINNQ